MKEVDNDNTDSTKKFDITKLLEFYMDPRTGGMNTKSIGPFNEWKSKNLYEGKIKRDFNSMRVRVLESLMTSVGQNVNLSSPIFGFTPRRRR